MIASAFSSQYVSTRAIRGTFFSRCLWTAANASRGPPMTIVRACGIVPIAGTPRRSAPRGVVIASSPPTKTDRSMRGAMPGCIRRTPKERICLPFASFRIRAAFVAIPLAWQIIPGKGPQAPVAALQEPDDLLEAAEDAPGPAVREAPRRDLGDDRLLVLARLPQ